MDNPAANEAQQERMWMQRSVSQLLFSYLPGKTVDWEDGLAIVQLGGVRLSSAWEAKQMQVVLKEIEAYLTRWQSAGGIMHSSFPDPHKQPERFTIGEPESISATVVDAALRCLSCNRLVFASKKQLAVSRKSGGRPFLCPSCGQPALRQFPQIFVHGCGHFVALGKWMPTLKHAGESMAVTSYPLLCQKCGARAIAEIPSRSERARDLVVKCRTCKQITVERLSARCHHCFTNPPPLPQQETPAGEEGAAKEPTVVDRVMMRITSYRASEAYYPHSLTLLRLDRPQQTGYMDEEVNMLRGMLPEAGEEAATSPAVSAVAALSARLQEAVAKGDMVAVNTLAQQIGNVATGSTTLERVPRPAGRLQHLHPDLVKSITESLALKTTVRTTPYTQILGQDQHGATAGLLQEITRAHQRLGLRPTLLVDDLPVISATFGYTRRSFEPTYEENGALLPTHLRAFYPLEQFAAKRIGRPGAVGTIPILAREGDHEGIFLGLDPERVLSWLAHNDVRLPSNDQAPIVHILQSLEEVDRYYDTVWQKPVLRLVFGLLHSLSHAAMRIVSRFAGLERTSISEYLFPPLLGTVIYANSSTFKMGCMETMMRSSLFEFLEALGEEAMTCLIDPDCIDHRGACAGCLYSPEISCRVFNHGLSRAFLIGGHTPWLDVSIGERIRGYWQE